MFNTVLLTDGESTVYNWMKEMGPETIKILKQNGVSYVKYDGNGHRERIVVEKENADPQHLRNLGFRLGHGKGHIQYLMYYRGQFCGIIE